MRIGCLGANCRVVGSKEETPRPVNASWEVGAEFDVRKIEVVALAFELLAPRLDPCRQGPECRLIEMAVPSVTAFGREQGVEIDVRHAHELGPPSRMPSLRA
jgi:hypothetical protein